MDITMGTFRSNRICSNFLFSKLESFNNSPEVSLMMCKGNTMEAVVRNFEISVTRLSQLPFPLILNKNATEVANC